MFNVPHLLSKLFKPNSRMQFNSNELSGKMLCEIIDLLSPEGSTLMDPYAGTLTTCIALVGTPRSCISIDIIKQCFKTAVIRLYTLLPKYNLDSKTFVMLS